MRTTTLLACCTAAVLAALTAGEVVAAEDGGIDYVILVDNTGSMRYGNRAEGTLSGLEAFAEAVSIGDRISAFSYGERVEPLLESYPLLITGESSKAVLKGQLVLPFTADRTDITAAVERVWEERYLLFPNLDDWQESTQPRKGAVILVTDGTLIPVYDDYAHYDRIYAEKSDALRDVARRLGDLGIAVHVLGVGRPGKVDDDLNRYVAEASGGTFALIEDPLAVSEAYTGIVEDMRETIAQASRSAEPVESEAVQSWTTDVASAAQYKPYERSTNLADHVPDGMFERYAAILAVFVGAIALGVDKRKPWAMPFVRKVGGSDTRVRGYLRPVDAPGVFSARPIVGLENPGLPSIKVGTGTPYVTHAHETVAEFKGTNDGSPPELVAERGKVLVEGEEVAESRKLRDGDLIEIEGVLYRYLRGNRR
jgi:hypothetical protein